ncbi:MAG: 2-succinyl-6-hydroxy-2,4-cyclohexadiene-1-carboxylate synthase [Ignavibacteriaceae bacterium]|jgi:2-succinyl-6-hydroxy-2,4-cyclohexadiene-1-carboxylate synthase|nr:2-succinyl-6-hydroxy-2,4-cyclohexadiene-1-carboxylate synthase [Ignavibacteriaceae bacterium]
MKFDINGLKINAEIPAEIDQNKKFVFFLHGFTGCAEEWLPVIAQMPNNYNYVAIDIIGHGKSDYPSNSTLYSVDSLVQQIKFIKDKLTKEKIFLLGYSMGGRLALNFTVNYPEDLSGLILESSTAGIKNDDERSKRYETDLKLVEYIESHSIEEFIELWSDQELFNTQLRFSNDKLKMLKKKKAAANKIGYANSLRGFSTGIMPPVHDQLKKIPFKVLLITGDLDSKFTGINARIAKRFFKAKHKIVRNSGHNTHLEEPKRFIEIVTNYLGQF